MSKHLQKIVDELFKEHKYNYYYGDTKKLDKMLNHNINCSDMSWFRKNMSKEGYELYLKILETLYGDK